MDTARLILQNQVRGELRFDFKKETFAKYRTWKTPIHRISYNGRSDEESREDYKGWLGTVDYTIAKNLGVSAYAGYRSKTQDGEKLPNYYGIDVNVNF